jgi:hypothetical protein
LFLEIGAQYRAVVEYAPYQRVPKPRSKKDVREGTIMKGMVEESFISMWGLLAVMDIRESSIPLIHWQLNLVTSVKTEIHMMLLCRLLGACA